MKKTLNYNTLLDEPIKVTLNMSLEEVLKDFDDDILLELSDNTVCFYNRRGKELTKFSNLLDFVNKTIEPTAKSLANNLSQFSIWDLESLEVGKIVKEMILESFSKANNENIKNIYTFNKF
jgi:hypothetical protein